LNLKISSLQKQESKVVFQALQQMKGHFLSLKLAFPIQITIEALPISNKEKEATNILKIVLMILNVYHRIDKVLRKQVRVS